MTRVLSRRNSSEHTLTWTRQRKKLKRTYSDLEESQRKRTSGSQVVEVATLKRKLNRLRREQAAAIEVAKAEVTKSCNARMRLMEGEHANQDQRKAKHIEQRYMVELEDLHARNKQLEKTLKEQTENPDQKGVVAIKGCREFAMQKQDLVIMRSKERHLEMHVSQLEAHMSKVRADYEAKLQGSGGTVCSSSGKDKALKKQIHELKKKLVVSNEAVKQMSENSLIVEKENVLLKQDNHELELKLKHTGLKSSFKHLEPFVNKENEPGSNFALNIFL